MSVQAVISSETAQQSIDATGLTREYAITDTTGIALTYDQAIGSLPALSSSITVNGATLYCQSREVDADPEGIKRKWTGRVQWSTNTTSDATFVALDMSTSALTVDIYRANPAAPGSLDAPGNTDIGGTPVDQNGQPISTIIPQQELSITNYRTDNNAAACRAAIGKRNSAAFLGAAAGYVLFTGATARRVGVNRYEVVYKMVFDNWAHCRQVAVRDADGRVKTGAPDGAGLCNASTVVWRQPFPATYNFGSLGIVTS